MANPNNKAFNYMTTAADKTSVDLLKTGEIDKSTKSIHDALMAAGMTPGLGNIADLTDATLYALEGEFGDAAWSAAAAIPVIGQMVAGRKALKAAKESGEKMITVYRGIPDWYKRDMVKKNKYVGGRGVYKEGGKKIKDTAIWVSKDKKYATSYTKNIGHEWGPNQSLQTRYANPRFKKRGYVLEFEMPKSYFNKFSEKIISYSQQKNERIIFQEGIPKEFLKKVHR